MKKRLILVIVTLTLTNLLAFSQVKKVDFGIKGGLNLTFFNVEQADFGPNARSETGYYAGAYVDFEIDEFLSIQPELLYVGLNDFRFLNAPIYAKYEVADKFNLMVGPSLNYFFDFFTDKFKVRGDLSAAYQITPALNAHIKYTLGFEVLAPNGLFFGLGLKL
ncbi:hypothetical protein ESY87_11450 [Subsaximicrobium wynnwilliamsii]|nr:hypothetical protein [Subsaximicrobium wynnwilliamsii]TXD83095.1 hypothetical protein ESY87_11450 [Subsaximicrobium wynnwilliamsii]